MLNMMNIMKQAQNMQKRILEIQEELASKEVFTEVGNGSIKVVCDGKGIFKSIKIAPEAINPENPSSISQDNIEMLEDLILSALNQATEKTHTELQTRMKEVTGGVNIPGLT